MIVTNGFLTKVVTFLKQIEYPYTDRYYPEIIDRSVNELLPNGQDIEIIADLLSSYRYMKNREKKILKVFETPKYLSRLLSIEPSSFTLTFKRFTKNYDQVVVTNALSGAFKILKTFQVYSTQDDRVTSINKDKAYFTQDFNSYKLKTFVRQVELYRYDDKIMKFSLDYFMKKYRYKQIEMTSNYTLEQDGSVFKVYTRNLDQEKILIGTFEFKVLRTTYVHGLSLIKIMDEQYHDMLAMLGLGMLYSIMYSENARRSSN